MIQLDKLGGERLALLQAIEDEFHAAGNIRFFEDAKKIISHDLLRESGWPAQRITLTC